MSKKRYPPRIPRTAHGFRAQELRNLPREAWWAKRWMQAIEAMKLGARAGRGRSYAENGQIVSMSAEGTHVEATAVGSRPGAYAVKMDFAPFPAESGDGSGDTFAKRIGVMSFARILAGDMPVIVDEVFASEGMSPYPTIGPDRFWCSCPDWSKPCKHIAAVLYLLGDAIARDPYLLLRLRGIELAPEENRERALPLWKGSVKLSDALAKIYRRTGV